VAAFDFKLTRVMGIFVAIRVPTPEPLLEAPCIEGVTRSPLRTGPMTICGFPSSVS
jgi:hypothetical protein